MVVKCTFYGSGTTVSEQRFWSKTLNISIFSEYYWSFLDNIEKTFSGVTKLQKIVSRKFFFRYHYWSLSDFLVFLAKFFIKLCQTSNQRAERKKLGKLTFEKVVFFLQKINFGIGGEKTWTFSKIVRHDSQNRRLTVQMTIFRNFSGSKTIWMEVFGHWTEKSVFRRKWFLRVVKGAFQVSSETLCEKDDRSKF